MTTPSALLCRWFPLCFCRSNNHLQKKGYPPIVDAALDFESGIKLMQLVSALYDLPMPKHNANPKMRPHKLDNIALALAMVRETRHKNRR